MWKYRSSPANLKKIKGLLCLRLLQKTKMGEYLKSWNRTRHFWELSPDFVKHLTGRERGQRLTDRQTERRLFPYENECRAKRTTEPDTRFSFIMSFSGNNLSQRQNGDALRFPTNAAGCYRGGKGRLTSFSEWMKMTYTAGPRASKWSCQGYTAQEFCLI